ncbi:helix-turn-helix domain-containing protein [Streptomyces sp. NPDC047981]|uniref:helix-turn-helix domain-containing protein n=1 Tax=Streptomyces sp. NPDC047981 TaxID=3154610 RepID=UPI00341305FF
MVQGARSSLPDPAAVSSVAELAAAAKALVAALGLKQNQVAQRSQLSEGTISGLFNGRSCPREDTFESFITMGCDQPWKPWHEAWARARSERRRPSSSDLSAQVEELRAQIECLEATIKTLSASINELLLKSATPSPPQDWAQQSRRERGVAFLAAVGPADLIVTSGLRTRIVLADQVEAFLARVRELALQDMNELASFVLTHTGAFSRVFADEPWDTGYDEVDVAKYVSRLREEVNRYLGVEPATQAETNAPLLSDPWTTESASAWSVESEPAGGRRPAGGYGDEPPF